MMNKLFYFLVSFVVLTSCSQQAIQTTETTDQPVNVSMDLMKVLDDKVNVTVNPGRLTTDVVIYNMPKTVPGTYSTDNYGRLIENVKAFDYKGKELKVTPVSENKFSITNGQQLDYITYSVNDSFDIENELGIFSPAGTNIAAGENFMLNLHGFVGYFNENTEIPYVLNISRPLELHPSTSLAYTENPAKSAVQTDTFTAKRYFEVTDNPIQYQSAKSEDFMVDDIRIVLDVYSPNNTYSAKDLRPNIEKMVKAQKAYLGDINDTPLYAILLYLSDMMGQDAGGFGALEHHTSTVVVLPEQMPLEALNQRMTDVVSHEFFHTLTPLNVHSEEIHYFDYADPKMSKHLWMYEGVTEYFANHFQVHEKLITPDDFYKRMQGKIIGASRYNDTMPFTEMSENVLKEPYDKQYTNVYEKGALIAMALDIRLRELSGGKTGILHLMGELSKKYGVEKPFKDDELIATIVELTDPSIQDFFDTYVSGPTPINYEELFAKVGLEKGEVMEDSGLFLKDMQTPLIDADGETKTIFFPEGIPLNSMLQKLGVQEGDEIVSFLGTEYNLDTIQGFIMSSMALQPGAEVTMVVNRDGKEVALKSTYEQPKFASTVYKEMNLPASDARVKLREAWLFN